MGIGQVLTMPLFFASNAIYPIEIMPGWLKIVSRVNPLTYVINAIRPLMLHGMDLHGLTLDFSVMILVCTVCVTVGGMLYRRVII